MKKLSKLFPTHKEKNILLYYLISAFSSGWFIIGTWLFYALRYITIYQMGILESVSFGIGLILEVPSGAVADLLGKKLTTQVGLGLLLIGMTLFSLAEISPWLLIIGNILIVSAWAFISGSLEALVYDTLVENKKEKHYDIIASRASSISPLVFIIVSVIGGILWKFNIHLPNIFSILSFLIAFILSFFLKEPTVDTYVFSWKQFKQQSVDGFKQLTKIEIKKYLPIFVSISAGYYMWGAGIIRITMGQEFGYNAETLSYLISLVGIVSVLILFKFDQIKKLLGNKKGLFIIGIISVVGWFLAGVGGNFLTGAITFLLLTISGQLHRPWVSSTMNKHIPSKLRATTISTMQFLVQMPYVLVVIFFGLLVESGQTYFFYYLTSILIGLSIVYTWFMTKQNNSNSEEKCLKK